MSSKSRTRPPRQLRIIGGEWRGRKLRFPPIEDIRPTPDRVRETLFNWLMHDVRGAIVLDLFAGSGALGFEAASRGAAHVTMIERDPLAARALVEAASQLGSERIVIRNEEALRFLDGAARPFDIVFLDPPFDSALLGAAASKLEQCGWLATESRIHVESSSKAPLAALPPSWRLLREGRAGEVRYHLYASQKNREGEG